MNLKLYLVCGAALAISGCVMPNGVKLPGHVSSTYSEFDKTTEIRLEPVWANLEKSNSYIAIGFFKSTRMNKNDVTFIAEYLGIDNIANGKSLQFNVDGKIISLSTIDNFTKIETAHASSPSKSSRRYSGNIDLIKKILKSRRTLVRLSFSGNQYVEGTVISPQYNDQKLDKKASILPKPAEAFARFLQKVEKL